LGWYFDDWMVYFFSEYLMVKWVYFEYFDCNYWIDYWYKYFEFNWAICYDVYFYYW